VFDPAPEDPGIPPPVPPPRILPVQRVGAIAEIFLCSGLPTQLFLMAVLTGFGLRIRTSSGGLSPTFVFTLSLLDTVLVIALVLFFLRVHRESPRDVLLGGRPIVREAFLGIALLPLIFVLLIALLAIVLGLAPQLHNVPRNPLEDMIQNRRDALIFGMVVMIAGGVREEVQRGFILRRFDQYLGGGGVGVIVYSALFGLGHVEQGIDAALVIAVLGALWGGIYLMRGSIVAPMVSHALFNLLQLVKHLALR
jgi:membrane protease YdiL (CAAX protease family)